MVWLIFGLKSIRVWRHILYNPKEAKVNLLALDPSCGDPLLMLLFRSGRRINSEMDGGHEFLCPLDYVHILFFESNASSNFEIHFHFYYSHTIGSNGVRSGS